MPHPEFRSSQNKDFKFMFIIKSSNYCYENNMFISFCFIISQNREIDHHTNFSLMIFELVHENMLILDKTSGDAFPNSDEIHKYVLKTSNGVTLSNMKHLLM